MPTMTASLDFQAQALMLRAQRQQVLAGNIANADTPGFQARDMDFANALRAATGQSTSHRQALTPGGMPEASHARYAALGAAAQLGGQAGAGPGLATSTVAMARGAGAALSPVGEDPQALVYARHSQDAVDQNTVDMDRERATFADNSARYEAALRFINGGVRTMLDAMKSHNQG